MNKPTIKLSHVYLFLNDGNTKTRYDLEKWAGQERYPAFHVIGKRSKTGLPSLSFSKKPLHVHAVFGRAPAACIEAPSPMGYISGLFEPYPMRHPGWYYGDAKQIGGNEAFLCMNPPRAPDELHVWIFPGQADESQRLFVMWIAGDLDGMTMLEEPEPVKA